MKSRLYCACAHRVTGENDFEIDTLQDLIDTVNQVTTVLVLFLGTVAGISLLVGGIGVMNIMLVSVTERTREIGIRKAMGAKRRDILLQFITEAVFLTTAGGIIGLLLSFALSPLTNWGSQQCGQSRRRGDNGLGVSRGRRHTRAVGVRDCRAGVRHLPGAAGGAHAPNRRAALRIVRMSAPDRTDSDKSLSADFSRAR